MNSFRFLFTFSLFLFFSAPINAQLFADYYDLGNLDRINLTNTAGAVSTIALDTQCETFSISVTDPMNMPLGGFNPYIVRTQNENGDQILDITDNVNVTVRARSLAEVNFSVLFRSGGGSTDERSDRKDFTIPAGLEEWTEFTLEWGVDDLAGFETSDLRDLWFYLDRGEENFAGNEIYIDHIIIGGSPASDQNSPCPLMEEPITAIFSEYYQGDSIITLNTTSAAAVVSTITLDTLCETLAISVTDPTTAPLPAFNAYLVKTIDENGDQILDITDNVNVTVRARSLVEVNFSVLFRSGGGSTDERSDRKDFTIPAGLEEWTEFTLEWGVDDLAGFETSDLRDLWFYLDRGEENFAGNEIYIDHIIIGGPVDQTQYSACPLIELPSSFEEYFQGDSLVTINPNSIAGETTTFSLDTDCETLTLSITDPSANPLPPFNAYQFNPIFADGSELLDLTDNVNTTFRVRSEEAITIDVLFRSGGGTTSERSDRKSFFVPAGLEEWTEFTLSWGEGDLVGFDPADFRDMWFYLDRGMENFNGNLLFIDHITVGINPDMEQNTECLTVPVPQDWVENWSTDTPTEFTGSDIDKLTLTINDCEEIKIEVADPANNAYGALRPMALNPINGEGFDIALINENPFVNIRARSAEDVELSVLLRSRDGSSEFRTEILTKTIIGDLDGYSNLLFEFDVANIGGFDINEFVDIWIYLDREVDNFAGNEVYFDYVTLGVEPTLEDYSPCGLPDLVINNTTDLFAEAIQVYPNPVRDFLNVELSANHDFGNLHYEIRNLLGQVIIVEVVENEVRHQLDLQGLDTGIYFLNIYADKVLIQSRKIIKVES